MRWKTSSSGILRTKRNRPVSTSKLTRILVPNPKNAFQSPGVHNFGSSAGVDVTSAMGSSSSFLLVARPLESVVVRQCLKDPRGVRHPPENPALRLDHLQGDVMKLLEVRRAAIARDDAAEAAIVGFADG